MPSGTIMDNQLFFHVIDGRKVWRSYDSKRYFTWDSMHGEIEVFNIRGRHLGVLDPFTGVMIKSAVHGRLLNVK